jgi:hypothetical protein
MKFSIRTALLAFLIVGLLLGWLREWRQRRAVEAEAGELRLEILALTVQANAYGTRTSWDSKAADEERRTRTHKAQGAN